MLELGTKLLLSYLLGSLNGALIIGKLRGVDIRRVGSGNAGGTNALRTQGPVFALFVMIIDVGKGWLPAALLPALVLPGIAQDPDVSRVWLMLACGGASIAGHCFPVWFNFRGGKGAATTVGVLIAVAPALLLPGAIVFVGVLVLTGYVGLSTICAAIAMPAWLAITSWRRLTLLSGSCAEPSRSWLRPLHDSTSREACGALTRRGNGKSAASSYRRV